MLDRQPPGRYMMILDIPPRDEPIGWDVELLSLETTERVVLKREMPENTRDHPELPETTYRNT